MKAFAIFLVGISSLLLSGCGTKGEPVAYGSACDAANDKKTLEVSGFLEPRSSIYCSNRGGRMECPFDFVETAGSDKKMTADIATGRGADTMDEVPKGFKKEDLRIRDNAGSPVALATDMVKLTGKMMIAPGAAGNPGVCLMQVYKIEK